MTREAADELVGDLASASWIKEPHDGDRCVAVAGRSVATDSGDFIEFQVQATCGTLERGELEQITNLAKLHDVGVELAGHGGLVTFS